ncbi:hypothetical protein QJS10_CPA07g00387 [Acorus calamus]|uniref:Uncharacterized protein n=1 Tax=Acorus calamus TaxID=4465 RepID=A0AAV9EIG2_ACOCL|nr:hypothetical protein QJS10_CPA07g00387 [Acorus calamus]
MISRHRNAGNNTKLAFCLMSLLCKFVGPDGESLEDIREALCGLNGVSWPHQGISGFPQLPCSTNVQIHQDGNALLLNRCWAPILISANGLDRRALSGVEFMLPGSGAV